MPIIKKRNSKRQVIGRSYPADQDGSTMVDLVGSLKTVCSFGAGCKVVEMETETSGISEALLLQTLAHATEAATTLAVRIQRKVFNDRI